MEHSKFKMMLERLRFEKNESNLETIRKLVNAKLDDILQYTCMILQGSEMGTPEQVSKWKFETKYQILPEDFTTLSNGKRICEYGESVVSSKDLSFDEYIELRMIALTLWLTNKGILYNSLFRPQSSFSFSPAPILNYFS